MKTLRNMKYVSKVIGMTIFAYPRIKLFLMIMASLIIVSNWFETKWHSALFNGALQAFKNPSNLSDQFMDSMATYAYYIFGHYIFGALYMSIFYYCTPGLEAFVAARLHERYLESGYAEYSTLGSGKINAYITKQTEAITGLFEVSILHFGCDFIFYLIMIYSILYKCKDAYLTVFLIFFLTILAISAFQSVIFSTRIKSRQLRDLAHRMAVQHDIVSGYPIIKSFNNEDFEIKRLELESQRYISSSKKFNMFGRVYDFLFRTFVVTVMMAVLYCVFFGLFFQKANFESAKIILDLIPLLKKRTQTLNEKIFKISEFYADLLAFKMPEPEEKEDLESIEDFKREIRFENVSISRGVSPLISNFNLSIRKGQKVAITGKNGCGKSSILSTMMKFNDYKGSIEIDDYQISKINGKSLRNIISFVPQESMLLSGTVFENLIYSNPSMTIEEVEKICKEFGFHELFKNLKDGYFTVVGEQGRYLSGGQCQMINFMRAVIKNAPIFFLDEPTSNLDSDFTSKLVERIFSSLKDKTVLMTTHDPEHLKHFDIILNINNKNVRVFDSYEKFSSSVSAEDLI